MHKIYNYNKAVIHTCKYEEYGFFHYGEFHTLGVRSSGPFLRHLYTISSLELGDLETQIYYNRISS